MIRLLHCYLLATITILISSAPCPSSTVVTVTGGISATTAVAHSPQPYTSQSVADGFADPIPAECSDGWFNYKESCYYIGHGKSFNDALKQCRQMNSSYFADFNEFPYSTTEEKQNVFVKSPVDSWIWTGGFLMKEGNFDFNSKYLCEAVRHSSTSLTDISWHPCDRTYHYVCERNATDRVLLSKYVLPSEYAPK